MTTPAEEITAAVTRLRTARFTGAMTATPAVAALLAAREPIARWLASWQGIDFSEAAALPEDAQHAIAIARALNASQP